MTEQGAVARQVADNPSLDGEVEVRFLAPDEYWRIDPLFDREGTPRLDPNFSKVVVALDGDRVAGIMVMQMVLHVEPIVIEPEYRKQGLWRPMAEMVDGYLSVSGAAGAYAQPIHESTKHMCREWGFEELANNLFCKLYQPGFAKPFPDGPADPPLEEVQSFQP